MNRSHPPPELRVASSGMAWKGAESEGVTALAANNIKWAQWLRVARGFQLRIGLKDYTKEKFDGFVREVGPSSMDGWMECSNLISSHLIPFQDFDRLSKLMKDHFSLTLEPREISFKGWNWGVTDFQGAPHPHLFTSPPAQNSPVFHR